MAKSGQQPKARSAPTSVVAAHALFFSGQQTQFPLIAIDGPQLDASFRESRDYEGLELYVMEHLLGVGKTAADSKPNLELAGATT